MAVALESASSHRSSLRVRVDPQDHHHHHDHHHRQQLHHQGHQSHHHWWHWRHKKPSADEEQQPTTRPQQHTRRVHQHHHAPSLEPKHSTLSKRLSSATACHDDPHSAHGRRKRIVLHAIFKC